jgi:hypothetical protein
MEVAMLNSEQIKNYKFLFWLTVGWWLVCLIFSQGNILNLSVTDCRSGVCNVTEKSWFGFGSTQNYVTFAQTEAPNLHERETSGRLPCYRFSLDTDNVSQHSGNPSANFVSLPVDFYWQKSATKYQNQLSAEQDFSSFKFNLSLLFFLNVWILALLAAGLVIWRKI